MYKYISQLSGALIAPLPADVNVMQVPSEVADYFLATIDFENGEYTYITIFEGTVVEEAKVVGAIAGEPAYLTLDRSDAREFSAGANYDSAVNRAAIRDISSSTATPDLVGSGVIEVSQTAYEVFLHVPEINIRGGRGIDVYGDFPNYTIDVTLEAACGGSSSGGSGDGFDIDLSTSGIIGGYASGNFLEIYADEPQFYGGAGINVDGSWPYYTISLTGGAGGSMSVTAGAGLSQTGSPTSSTTLFITNTGVLAGAYGDITINARGQITSVAAGFNPISDLVAGEGIEVSRVGGTVTLAAATAAVGVVGAVALADADDALDPNDETTAVTPKLLASVIADLESGQVVGTQNYSGEADADYTYLVPTTPFPLVLESGESAIVNINLTVRDNGSPATAQSYGLAAFSAVGNTRIFANRIIPQSNQSMTFVLAGPFNDSVAIKTTALPGGAAVTSYAINAIKV